MADVEVKDINLQPVASPAYYVGVDGTGKAIRVAPVVIPVQSVVGLTGTISQADLRGALGLGAAAYVGLGTTVNDAAYGDHTHTPASIGAEPSYGTGTASQYLRGDKTWQTLNKAAVGLSAVDNTADADKPISTSTQTALNGKEPSVSAGTTAQYWRGDKTWQPFPAFQPAVQFKDEGSNVGTAGGVSSVNFTGAGVSASEAGGELTVTITSGGGSGTVTSVSATAPAAGMSVSVANSTTTPSLTFALADDLAAVEGLSSTGFVRRTASNTWSASNVVATDISDSTSVGRSVLTAADTSVARTNLGLGTAAPLNVPASGNAAAGQVVKGNDTRLSDSRNPIAHNQAASTISDSTSVGRSVLTAADAAAARSAIGAALAVSAPINLTANTTLDANAKYSYSAGALTLTLPAAPSNGDVVVIYNTGTLLTTVVGRNGKTIMGLAQDMTLDLANKKFVFEYLSASGDWRLGA